MTNAAAELLAGLRQDHRNMAILLRLWQDQIELIGDDKQPDFALLRDVMRNMTVYSDAIHHPKEDLIYAGLRALQPSLAEGLEQVETEHEEIALMLGGGMASLQALTISIGLPFGVVLLIMCVGLVKGLREE
jgi:hemerythrin-like domain-containing protein